MPLGIYHPWTKALYERDGEGGIVVTDGDRTGRFTAQGVWIEGEIKECDPHLCGWVAGPQMMSFRMKGEADPSA